MPGAIDATRARGPELSLEERVFQSLMLVLFLPRLLVPQFMGVAH